MKRANVLIHGLLAGVLEERLLGKSYRFVYLEEYQGPPVSLTMPIKEREFLFDTFPPFFDGVLPEGIMLEGLLRKYKVDKGDYFGQLMRVGEDLVGAVTVEELEEQ